MELNFLVADNVGEYRPITLESDEMYSVKRRDVIDWRKWDCWQRWGDDIKLHDKVLHDCQWKKIMRMPIDIADGQGRR